VFLIGFCDVDVVYESGRDLLINERYIKPRVDVNMNEVNQNTISYLEGTSVTFLALGKNVKKNFKGILNQMTSLGSHFKEYRILFIDGNSTDGTRNIFDDAVKSSRGKEIVYKSVPSDNLVETEGA